MANSLEPNRTTAALRETTVRNATAEGPRPRLRARDSHQLAAAPTPPQGRLSSARILALPAASTPAATAQVAAPVTATTSSRRKAPIADRPLILQPRDYLILLSLLRHRALARDQVVSCVRLQYPDSSADGVRQRIDRLVLDGWAVKSDYRIGTQPRYLPTKQTADLLDWPKPNAKDSSTLMDHTWACVEIALLWEQQGFRVRTEAEMKRADSLRIDQVADITGVTRPFGVVMEGRARPHYPDLVASKQQQGVLEAEWLTAIEVQLSAKSSNYFAELLAAFRKHSMTEDVHYSCLGLDANKTAVALTFAKSMSGNHSLDISIDEYAIANRILRLRKYRPSGALLQYIATHPTPRIA